VLIKQIEEARKTLEKLLAVYAVTHLRMNPYVYANRI